jgi:lipopolysaccharide export system permease protein
VLKIIDRHVLKQIATPLVAAMAIGLLMLLAERLVRLLDNTLAKKNSFAVVFELLAYLVPHYLGTAIPAALFLGLLLGFGKMSANSETDAFMAAGVGLNRMARPVILLAVLLSFASLFIFGWAQPYTRYAYRSVVFDVSNVDVFYLAQEGVFMQAGARTFILDSLDRSKNAFERAFIYEDRGAAGSDTITASNGSLIEIEGNRRPVLRLVDGHRLSFKEKVGYDINTTSPPEIAEFAIADTPLGKINKEIFRPRGEDHREQTLPELWSSFDNPPNKSTRDEVRTEFHKRLVNIVSMLILPFLAIPFAVGGRRSRSSSRIGVALVLIIVYHEIIEQGSVIAGKGLTSPWLALWLPFGLLSLFAGWRYYNACFTIKRDALDRISEWLGDGIDAVRGGILRRLGWEGRA